MNVMVYPLIAVSVLLIAAITFALWAYSGRQDYKNNVDQKIATSNKEVIKKTQADDQTKYAEAAKNPYSVYKGPSNFGSVSVTHPKTWSVYVDSDRDDGNGLSVYMNPGKVSPISSDKATSALRVTVVSEQYSSAVQQFSDLEGVKISAYKLPKVKNVVGTRIDGQIEDSKKGSMIVLPLRDKTLKIWTESNSYLKDFNKIVLANFTFNP